MKTILVIDDEKDLIKLIDFNLSKEGYLVIGAKDGVQGLEIARKHKPDLILLDIMMPKMDGWEVCKKLKSGNETAHIPIIMLTARAQESDKVLGLELGADDYMAKPFNVRELTARVKAVLRRTESVKKPNVIKIGDLNINYSGREVLMGQKSIDLTNTEFNLLWYLVNHRNMVVNRDDLITAGRGDESMVLDRTVDVHIASLRKKLGRHKNIIETIRAVGYKLNDASFV